MDLDVFKNNLSPGQENLLLAVESSTLVQVSKQFETLSKSERDENFLDYVLLVTALERGHRSMAKFLLKNGCRVKIPVQTQIFCTPLYYAVELHELDIIKNLIRAGASIYDHDKNKTSPFKLAVQKQQFMAVDFMVDYLMTTHQPRSLDPNCEIDIAVFHMACWRGNRKAVKRFLECRFSASSRSKFDEERWIGYTPIHFALEGLSQSVAELLLEHDIVDHHAMDHSGKTPLLAAFTNEKFPRKYSDRMIEKYVLDFDKRKFRNPAGENGLSHFHLICAGSDAIDPVRHVECVQFFINNGADLNSSVSSEDRYQAGYTALHFAVENSRLNVVERLLANGADPNKVDERGLTPLHFVCKDAEFDTKPGRIAIADLLLQYGANVDAQDSQSNTPLHYAFFSMLNDHSECLRNDSLIQLLFSKTRLTSNITNSFGLSYFHIASFFDLHAVETLMKRGASVHSCVQSNAQFKPGYSALHFAVSSSKVKIVEYLLDHGADPNIGINSEEKLTPIHLACCHEAIHFKPWVTLNGDTRESHQLTNRIDRLLILKLLLNRGAFANVQDSSGNTPLSYVCQFAIGNVEHYFNTRWVQQTILEEVGIRQKLMIDILIRYGADINSPTIAYTSILHQIARERASSQRKELAEAFLKSGANVNSQDHAKCTPLHVAVKRFVEFGRDDGFIDLLLDYGADINAKSTHLNTPLHIVMEDSENQLRGPHYYGNFVRVFKKFLDHPKIDLNAQNKNGDTLLHIAVRRNDHNLLRVLLNSGADVNVENFDKLSPIHLFIEIVKNDQTSWVRGVRLDCYTVMVSYVKKLIFNRSFPPEKYTEYFNRLSELYPEKFVLIDSLIFDEVELLRSKMIGHGIFLYDLLSKDSTCMARYAKNENLKTMIQSPILDIEFPIFHDRLRQQFSMGIERNSIYSKAKRALNFVTGQRWPEPCSEQILMYLHNVHLKSLIKSETIVVPPKRARFSTFSLDEPPRKLFRNA